MTFCHKPAQVRNLLQWQDGAWVGELAEEIPGVLNWAMHMPDEEVTVYLRDTETAVPHLAWLAKKAIIETNPLADWANTHLTTDPQTRTNIGVARRAEHSDRYECEDTWLYANYRAWADSTGNKGVSMRRFATTLHDLLVNQMGLPAEYRNDNKGSYFEGVRIRTASDKAEPLICPPEPAPVTDGTDTVTDETRASDGWDGFYGFSQKSPIDPGDTLPVDSQPDEGRVGGSKGEGENLKNPSKSVPSVTDAGVSHPTPVPSVTDAGVSHPTPVLPNTDAGVFTWTF
jgi:putative DNA primase/helicase